MRQLVREALRSSDLGKVNDAWGHAMEETMLKPFADSIAGKNIGKVQAERSKKLDMVIVGRESVALIELKSPLFLRDAIEFDPNSEPETWLRRTVAGEADMGGAIRQLRRHVTTSRRAS